MRHNLMVCRTGRNTLHRDWLAGDPDRNWDLCVLPYEPQGEDNSVEMTSGVVPGGKFDGIAQCMPSLAWQIYDFICWPDDDLRAAPGTWSRFFDYCRDLQPALAAPALTKDSIASHPVTVQHDGYVWRKTTFVEVMMPCFRRDIHEQLLPTLSLTTTGIGWGLDYVWPRLVNYEGIYVIDDTPVTHWRPSGTYKYMAIAAQEMNAMLHRYGVTDKPERILGGLDKS